MSNMLMTIPRLPDHPRFRIREGKAQFKLQGSGWYEIAWLESGTDALEDCCCVAICSWYETEMSYSEDQAQDIHVANLWLQGWRDYKKEMMPK